MHHSLGQGQLLQKAKDANPNGIGDARPKDRDATTTAWTESALPAVIVGLFMAV